MLIRPLGHHELLLLLFQLAALLLVARLAGEICRRARVPAVVGELSAGVFLGPSLLGLLLPEFQRSLFPPVQLQSDLLSVVTWLGLIFLLLSTGLETDLALIRRQGRRAPIISFSGIAITFSLGLLLGQLLPSHLLAEPDGRMVFSLFIATAMSISAIPVIARVLMEMQIIRRDIGQLILACGMIDDTVGWILLSVVAGLASSGTFDPMIPVKALLSVVAVLLFALTLGRWLVAGIYRWVDDHAPDGLLSLTVVLVLVASGVTLQLGLEAVLGAFVFGILLREAPRFRIEVTHSLELMTRNVFAPIFFAAAGLRVDLTVFADRSLLTWALVALAVACVGKFLGVFLGGRLVGLAPWERISMGAGLNARGAMEIIVATIGLSLGVLSADMYSIIVLIAIATSVMAPPLLRWALGHVEVGPVEAARLEHEEKDRTSFWAGMRRVLLPTRGGGNARFAAGLLAQAVAGRRVEVTVLHLSTRSRFLRWFGKREDDVTLAAFALKAIIDAVGPHSFRPRAISVVGRQVAQAIAEQALGHDLVILGATEEHGGWSSPHTFSPMIDEVLQRVTVPVLVVRSPGSRRISLEDEAPTPAPRRILVPSTGTRAGQPAVELGILLARQAGAECTILYVREPSDSEEGGKDEPSDSEEGGKDEPAWSAIPTPSPGTRPGSADAARYLTIDAARPGPAIVQFAQEGDFDLIVLSATLRPGARHAYLGPQVDHVLQTAPCPTAILVTS